MSDPNAPCRGCEIVAGRHRPVGGTVFETSAFVVHGVAAPSPLLGWMVLTAKLHAECMADWDTTSLAQLGPVLAAVMDAQKRALGSEHAYVFVLGDVLRHVHVHVVPRYPDTPASLRGRAAFDAPPAQMLTNEALEAAAEAVRVALTSSRLRQRSLGAEANT